MNNARLNLDVSPRQRRGIAAMALVMVLAMISLAILGMVLGGARDQDLTVSRLETLRSMYAAEGGAQMAMREVLTNTDADGDGAIGGVSDDGNASNNPSIGGATVWVDRSDSAGSATLDVKGSTSVSSAPRSSAAGWYASSRAKRSTTLRIVVHWCVQSPTANQCSITST